MVIGVLLVAAGTATLVGADNWTGQIDWTDQIDDIFNIDYDISIDSGVFMGAGDGGVPLGVILLAAGIITNLRPTDFVDVKIWSSD